jgi:hypothetical protein
MSSAIITKPRPNSSVAASTRLAASGRKSSHVFTAAHATSETTSFRSVEGSDSLGRSQYRENQKGRLPLPSRRG